MKHTITDETVSNLRVGEQVTVSTTDDYEATGLFVGTFSDVDGPRLRLLGADRLERRIPLPARVTTHV